MEVCTVKVDEYGSIRWYQNDKLHRTDGPAVERANGTKVWYQSGKRHRTDGPAIERADGTKIWYQNDKLHRTDGPAVEYADGSKSWYIEGKELTKREFKERTQPVKEMTIAQIQEALGFKVKVVEG